MRAIFEQILVEGFAAIERAVNERLQENVALEFKCKVDPTNGALTKKDRENLAENLSAFANSAGGLLLFGVQAEKDEEGVDAASVLVPIKGLKRFQSDVTRAVGELLLPRHDGIEVFAVPLPQEPDSGCLAVWVDRSERRPHQSQAAKDRRYYKRSGDSSFVMEHYDIEDAMRRTVVPTLDVLATPETGGAISGHYGRVQTFYLVFSLRNESPVTARFPYLHFEGMSFLRISRIASHALKFREQERRFDGGADDVIHPEQTFRIAAAELNIWTSDTESTTLYALEEGLHAGPIESLRRVPISTIAAGYRCVFGAENCRMKRAQREFDGEELRKLFGI